MMVILARHLLVSTVFAAIVAIFPFLMRKRSAASRHLVWLVAASKFALPAALFSFAGIELRGLFPARAALFAAPPVFAGFVPFSAPVASSPESAGSLSFLLLGVWACGAIVMLAVWLRRLLAPTCHSVAPLESEVDLLERLARRIGVRGHVALRSTKAKIEPGVTGLWRHTITVPEGLSSGLEAREFEAVLLHELAHVKRRDNLSAGFVRGLVCLFWFHPLLWWIERRVVAEQERACDEMVLRCGATPDDYASGILKVCRFHLAAAGACGITGSSLKERMEGIMSFESNRLFDRAPRLLIGALVSVMIVVPTSIGFLTSPRIYALGARGKAQAPAPVATGHAMTCSYAGKSYPMGSVISIGNGPIQQMCVQDAQGRSMFVRTNDAARNRSQKVIALPTPPPVTCERTAPSGRAKYCACQSGAGLSLFSPGSIVSSGKGPLRCLASGTWRAAIPSDFGGNKLPPPPKQ